MTENEIINFCEERDVEIYSNFNPIKQHLIIRMERGKFKTERGFPANTAFEHLGFGLSLRVTLRSMVDELDKMTLCDRSREEAQTGHKNEREAKSKSQTFEILT